ncbi:Leucine-rich repeat (LRR) protein [Breznakibacter xylanolyticus]|uniref:non-specific serine/threonine protein kinase n=1 Tax=Breznakibacter xylanolyticus TaxID=990 RepID=A0A2W7N0B6_9BACT|nr:C10 family peptidase [Breznakibacter xylanolyticus]PZX13835.1 Leucine-rich repeat (LRR) protein [Breznakibacter xylanolyticus]
MKGKLKFIPVVCLLLVNAVAMSQSRDASGARQLATEFFKNRRVIGAEGNTVSSLKSASSIAKVYQSPDHVKTPLFVFDNGNGGYAMVAQCNNAYRVVGYSDDGRFDTANIPPQLGELMNLYQDSLVFYASSPLKSASAAVVTPLLGNYNIRLNQFSHGEVGGCPTGCVATAVTQIMLYHAARRGKPINGYGAHCYQDASHGEICANFEGNTYDSHELLSFHVGNSMEMQYCGSPYGSIPNKDFPAGLEKYFHYYTAQADVTHEYIINELEQLRPVYISLSGEPVGHAFVVDGCDSRGFYHVDFGWGGSFNGYYLLNSNEFFGINNLKFFNNIRTPLVITPEPKKANVQDSLALVAIHHALGGTPATKWDLSMPVYKWPGVLLFNDRVIKLSISSAIPPASDQSISPEIGKLTALRELSFYGCLNGNIPASISNLTELQSLDIVNTSIYIEPNFYKGNLMGQLPNDIDRLQKLKSLNISNGLGGTLPAAIGNLSNLEMLRLTQIVSEFGRGNLSGSIPATIGNLSKLRVLNISNQNLSGTIPASLNGLLQLYDLDLSGNLLTGNVPMINLPNLEYLNLSENLLTGFEEGDSHCPVLKRLDLHQNQLAGDLPSYIGNFGDLEFLGLSDNLLSSIPESIGNLILLEKIELNNNRLTALPYGVALCVSLHSLSANHNLITSVPDNLGQSGNLVLLDLAFNNLTTIPDDLGNCPSLSQLFLNDNQITAIPASLGNINDNATVLLENNDLQGSIPLRLMQTELNKFVRLNNNRFVFDDIPQADNLKFGVRDQKTVALNKQVFNVQLGDTVIIDIRDISRMKLPTNEYYWLAYPEFQSLIIKDARLEGVGEGPVLTLVINEQNINNKYYCKVFNPASPSFEFAYGGSSDSYPCMFNLNTEPISFRLASDEEILAESYTEGHVGAQSNLVNQSVSDRTVTLVPPLHVKRGNIYWEASSDGTTWEKVSDKMTRIDLKSNVKSISEQALLLEPKNNAYYRCCLDEQGCDPKYSDQLLVKALGTVLFDEVINVTQNLKTISVDSIEVVVPVNFHDADFRLTITKLENGPASPKGVVAGMGYDVSVSFADSFDIPLLIKLKNIDKLKVNEKEINRFEAVYYDDKNQLWKPFENARLSLKDSTLNILTHHLTKMKWWWYAEEYRRGYTDVYDRNNILVFYNEFQEEFLNAIYGRKKPKQPWHVAGVPLMVQDITEYLPMVINKYKSLGLTVPEGKFKVYVHNFSGEADGEVSILGMLQGYLTISQDILKTPQLQQALAHEFMHYTQDYYISANGGNLFWMEAHATLSDRIVWDDKAIPEAESEEFLKKSLESSKFPFANYISNSWDHWDSSMLTAWMSGTREYGYLAGTFMHYMRSWRPGVEKLEPATLLKETSWFGGWRTYLGNYVSKYLNSNLGDEYEAYVKYLLSGENDQFTIINKKGNPFAYIQNYRSKKVFAHPVTYRFANGDDKVQIDQVEVNVPYMASKIIMLDNINPDTMVMVSYKRKHELDQDHKVYHVTYDAEKLKMNFVDISDSLQYSFLLESRNKDNARTKFKNTSFLLLINKEYIEAKDFDASIELTAMPIMNIENIAMLDIYNGSWPYKHTFTNASDYLSIGTPGAKWLSQVTGFRVENHHQSVSRQLLNSHTYRTIATFTRVIDQGFILGMPSMKDSTIYTQTIDHDVVAGTLLITEKELCYHKQHTFIEFVYGIDGNVEERLVYKGYVDYIKEREETYGLDDFIGFIQPAASTGYDEVYGDNIQEFKTGNTSDTKQVVSKLNAVVRKTNYDKLGGVVSVEENSYVATDFSNPNLVLYFIIKTKAD